MKRFLYAAMLASLAITGCGPKKEEKKAAPKAEQIITGEDEMTDEELLAVLDMLDDESDDLRTEISEAEEELEEEEEMEGALADELTREIEEEAAMELDEAADAMEIDEDADEMDIDDQDEDDFMAHLSREERDAIREQAMRELAAILRQDEEKRAQVASIGTDLFDPAFDTENMTFAERDELMRMEADAVAFAKRELEDAARESGLLGFESVKFAANSAEMLASEKEVLEKNIAIARAAIAAGRDIVCAGHAEDSAANPLKLSQQRAESLRQAFIEAGLNPAQLHATGYGETLGEFMNPASASCVELLVC